MDCPSSILPADRQAPIRAALAVLAISFAHGLLVTRFNFLIDDAFISFRFAAHWAEGAGLRYNLGAPPVEGYSNFLWVAALAGLSRVGVPLETGSRVLSIACGAALLIVLWAWLRARLGLPRSAALLGTLFVALSPPFAAWSTGGLETAAFALLLFAGFALVSEESAGSTVRVLSSGALGAGLALVRVDGVLWAVALTVLAVAVVPRWTRARSAWLIGALAATAFYSCFRRFYFGEWIANTVHAKAAFTPEIALRGARSVLSFFLIFPAALFALGSCLHARGVTARLVRGAGAMAALFCAYNVLVGGDWMPMFRFMAPAIPFFAVPLAAFLAGLRPARALPLGALCLALQLAPAFDWLLAPRALREQAYFRGFRAGYQTELERWRTSVQNGRVFEQIGRALGQNTSPGETLTAGAIGAVGYYSRLTIYDRNGLIEPSVARSAPPSSGIATAGHDKRVPRSFFLDRRPDYFEARLALGAVPIVLEPISRALAGQLRSEGDSVLLEHCVPEVRQLPARPGLPSEGCLVVLRAASPEEAREFWSRYGLL